MRLLIILSVAVLCFAEDDPQEIDGESSRKVLGSSVVTSVSVIMDTGNGSQAVFSDAVGKPVSKPSTGSQLASPINLLNPDRYEFYTFDDSGDLVKRLMTLDEIQGIIANGDGELSNYDSSAAQMLNYSPEKKVDDVVINVQNVLKGEIETHKNQDKKPLYDTPDVSSSWSMILPAIFGNSGADIKPERPMAVPTPETIMLEPTTIFTTTKEQTITLEKTTHYSPIILSNKPTKVTVLPTKTTPTKKPTKTKPTSIKITLNNFKDASQILPKPISTTKPTTARPVVTEMVKVPLTPHSTTLPASTTSETTTEKTVPSTFQTFTTFFGVDDKQEELTTTVETSLKNTETESTQTTSGTTQYEKQTEFDVSGILDQLLLSSTNIYQINSELSDYSTKPVAEDRFETTSEEPKTETTTDVPLSTTTDKNFIASIEQLISQAMGAVEEPQENENEAQKVQELLESSDNKNMSNIQEEAATVMSSIIGNPLPSNMIKDEPLLSQSVGSLISQIVGANIPSLTTVNALPYVYQTTENGKLKTTNNEFYSSVVEDRQDELELSTLTYSTDEPKETSTVERLGTTTDAVNSESASDELPKSTELNLEKIETTTETTETTNLETTTNFVSTTEQDTKTTNQEKLYLIIDSNNSDADRIIQALTESAYQAESSTTSTEEIPSTQVQTEAITTTSIPESISTSNDSNITWALVPTVPPSIPVPTTLQVDLVPQVSQGLGLEDTRGNLDSDVYKFIDLCNELAFGFWKSATTGISAARSVIASPFAATSLLAMVFLGARGSTSGEMNDILKLDDMVTFNPHLIFKNVTESIEVSKKSGVAVSAIIRQLYSDKDKGKLLGFYKERARQFYDGHVEEANFEEIEDVIRRRTNLLVKRYTWGKIPEYLKENSVTARPPLAAVSVSIFQTDCSSASTENRDGELHFVVSPTIRQRRLVPIPAAVWRSNFLAGYDPNLDATAVAIGSKDQVISTVFVMPGQQGISAPGDGLARLEKVLIESSFKHNFWSQLLRTLIPRQGLEVQIPRFSHKSILNATVALQRMGLKDLFDSDKADLRGLNGVAHELHLSDMLQINTFATCGEGRIDETHHSEIYPATGRLIRQSRKIEETIDYQRAFRDPLHDPTFYSLPLPLRPRQARVPESPRLRFDRPFLYFVRHNPTGLILHMGRFNPRLLP